MQGVKRTGFQNSVAPARAAAFKILRRVEEDRAFASVLLASEDDGLNQPDRALRHELVMGVLRHQLWLDRLIAHYGNREPRRLDLPVLLVLRLGLYQLRFLSRVPASAAVNEAVNLIRAARLRSAETLVNAILRRATREPEYDPLTDVSDPIERLSVETSHPLWLIERWISAFGIEETVAFARANNQAAPVALRVVRQRANEAEILEVLRAAGATLVPSEVAPGAWRVAGASNLMRQLAREGRVYLQDEASQLAAHLLDGQAGERVLDVCAAPGSKTTQIADMSGDRALLVAGDLHQHRMPTLIATALTHGLRSVRCVTFDALGELPFARGSFDRVLVDAPCTGTGTLRRNPEIRWRISPADIEDLGRRQSRILLNSSRMLKVGGRIVYSTCSVEPEENEQVVGRFGKETSFAPADLSVRASLRTSFGTARIWPHKTGADGFFIAAFERLN